ncbi:MAG: hypothetical protein AAF542_10145 [Pseudomonadota bacterium]
MLRFFFKPKWNHRNPVKRLRGIQELSTQHDEQHAILVDMAVNDLDPRVRMRAVEKVCDLPALNQIIKNEPDDIVLNTAQNRYYSLLAGTASDSTPDVVTGRYRIVDDSEDEDLKKFIIHHSPDEKLQFTALQALASVDDVARIAISAPNLKIRDAAARMAEQMANKVSSSPTPQALPEGATDTTSANDSIDALRAEDAKAKLRAEMGVRPRPPKGDAPAFRSSGDTLQIDDDSADALQALLDQKLASRKKA